MPKTIAVDFDGVIAQYGAGYQGKGIFGDPVPGVKEALEFLHSHVTIIIYTTRAEEGSVKAYLHGHSIPYDFINYNPENKKRLCSDKKPLADIYIDDRSILFKGKWDEEFIAKILNFQPYYKYKPKISVDELLYKAAEIYKLKNQDYGDSHHQFGEVMKIFFPKGVLLKTTSEFNKFGVLSQIISKLNRYVSLFGKKKSNFETKKDTIKDCGIYCFMLLELEENER